MVFVNTASSSGEFLKGLAGPGRTIVTATRTGGERNETRFPAFFVEAFTGDGADRDRNGRISVQEAFDYARTKVQQAFEREGYILSEHATLDDGGAAWRRRCFSSRIGRARPPRSPASRIPRCARRSRRSGSSRIRSPGSGCASRACRRAVRPGVREAGDGARAEDAHDPAARGKAMTRRVRGAAACLAGVALVATARSRSRPSAGGFGPPQVSPILPNTPYDGKFTFVRLRYGPPVPTRRSAFPGRTTTRPASATSCRS